MSLSAAERLRVEKLVVLMFQAGLSTNYFEDVASTFEARGRSIESLAQALSTLSLPDLRPPGAPTLTERILDMLGLRYHPDAIAFTWLWRFQPEWAQAVRALEAIESYTGSDPAVLAARAILDNKAAVSDALASLPTRSSDVPFLRESVQLAGADTASTAQALALILARAAPDAPRIALTAGADALTGTAFGEIFTGTATTYGAADRIDGAGGTDALLVETAGGPLPSAVLTNVEAVNIRNTGTLTASVDASAWTGIRGFYSDGSAARVAVTGLPAGAVAGIVAGSRVQGALDFAYAPGAAEVRLLFARGTDVSAAATNTDASSSVRSAVLYAVGDTPNIAGVLELDGNSVPNEIGQLTVYAAASLTATLSADDFLPTARLDVFGSAPGVSLGRNGNFQVIDAAGMTYGGITIALGTRTTSFRGAQGNDAVFTAQVATTTAGAIDAGAGPADRLIVSASADVDSADEANLYANFEELEVGDGVTVDTRLFARSFQSDPVFHPRGIDWLRTRGTATITMLPDVDTVAVVGDAHPTFVKTGPLSLGLHARYDSAAAEAADADHTLTITHPDAPGYTAFGVYAQTYSRDTAVEVTSLAGLPDLRILNVAGLSSTVGNLAAGSIRITSGPLFIGPGFYVDGSGFDTLSIDFRESTGNGINMTGGHRANFLATAAGTDTIRGGDVNDTIMAGIQAPGTANEVTGWTGGDTIVFTPGENTNMRFAEAFFPPLPYPDSHTVADVVDGYSPDAMDTLSLADARTADVPFVDGIAGARFTLDTAGDAPAVSYRTTPIQLGATGVAQPGEFVVYDTRQAGVAFVYQDTNRNSVIDAGEFAVRLVGAPSGFDAAEFSVIAGNLAYSSR